MAHPVERYLQLADDARRSGRIEEGINHASFAVAEARHYGHDILLARSLKKLGQLKRDKGEADEALKDYTQAAEVLRRSTEPLLLAHTLRHIGDIYLSLNRAADAAPFCEEALKLFRLHGTGDPTDLANTIRVMALLREQQGERTKAIRLWREAAELYAGSGQYSGVDECMEHVQRLGG